VIGHDRGGVLAWRMAAQSPERVNRLVAVSVGHPESLSDPDIAQIERFWYNFRFQFPDAEEFLRADDWKVFRAWMRNHPETDGWIESLSEPSRLSAFVNFWRANTNPMAPKGERVTPVAVPVTAIWSAGDSYCNERQMLRSEPYATAGWTYRRIENASHFMQLDQPDELNALLLEALRK
jgi:pimeloyl-ACP methyl ester carboxylesterase